MTGGSPELTVTIDTMSANTRVELTQNLVLTLKLTAFYR